MLAYIPSDSGLFICSNIKFPYSSNGLYAALLSNVKTDLAINLTKGTFIYSLINLYHNKIYILYIKQS